MMNVIMGMKLKNTLEKVKMNVHGYNFYVNQDISRLPMSAAVDVKLMKKEGIFVLKNKGKLMRA